MNKFITTLFFCVCTNFCYSQSVIFTGAPSVKVTEGGVERNSENLVQARAKDAICVIMEIEGKFFWASRDNKQLVKIDTGGAFLIFLAADGSGYIRVIKKDLKEAASLMSATERTFDYVEHLLLGLRSVTYYGKSI
jgi:hypothetical protein